MIMVNFLKLDQVDVGWGQKKMLSDFSEWRHFKEEHLFIITGYCVENVSALSSTSDYSSEMTTNYQLSHL